MNELFSKYALITGRVFTVTPRELSQVNTSPLMMRNWTDRDLSALAPGVKKNVVAVRAQNAPSHVTLHFIGSVKLTQGGGYNRPSIHSGKGKGREVHYLWSHAGVKLYIKTWQPDGGKMEIAFAQYSEPEPEPEACYSLDAISDFSEPSYIPEDVDLRPMPKVQTAYSPIVGQPCPCCGVVVEAKKPEVLVMLAENKIPANSHAGYAFVEPTFVMPVAEAEVLEADETHVLAEVTPEPVKVPTARPVKQNKKDDNNLVAANQTAFVGESDPF